MLKPVVVVALVAVAVSTAPRLAQAGGGYPWCANNPYIGSYDCSYVTFQQCLYTVRGAGGTCDRNLYFRGRLPPQRRYVRAWWWW